MSFYLILVLMIYYVITLKLNLYLLLMHVIYT